MSRESHYVAALWRMAIILRDSTEPLALFDVIRGILLLKYAAVVSQHPAHPNASFVIPAVSKLSHLQTLDCGLATALKQASQELEESNPRLAGTLTSIDYCAVARSSESRQNEILRDMIATIAQFEVLNAPSELGTLYDLFAAKTLTESGFKSAGEFMISAPLTRLMVGLLDIQSHNVVYDPFCRTGRTLVECASIAHQCHLKIDLHGQDPNERMCALARTNLVLHDRYGAIIECADALRLPPVENGSLMQYDRIISSPPINRVSWGAEQASRDVFGRFPIIPPDSSGDYAYVLHCLASLNTCGRAVILGGRGILFREGREADIRRMLVINDNIEAVIGLPGGLLYGTHIPAAILVLRKGENTRRRRVLFVEARSAGEQRARDYAIRQQDIDTLIQCMRQYESVEGLAKVVDINEIEQNNWNLNPNRYIRRIRNDDTIDWDEQMATIHQLEQERDQAITRVNALLAELRDVLKT